MKKLFLVLAILSVSFKISAIYNRIQFDNLTKMTVKLEWKDSSGNIRSIDRHPSFSTLGTGEKEIKSINLSLKNCPQVSTGWWDPRKQLRYNINLVDQNCGQNPCSCTLRVD